MLRDVYWRQYPVDLLSDDKMACVEAMLPDDQKHIPYMIYIAALKLCDNDGVFDVDDGVVLARLSRVKDVKIVLHIVNLMRQRKILFRLFDNSTLCGLVDWTYSEKDKKVRTIEERRQLVAARIKQEQARAGVDKDFTLPGEQAAPQYTAPTAAAATAAPKIYGAMTPEVQAQIERCKKCDHYDAKENTCTDRLGRCNENLQEAQTAPAADASLCAENDKKAENVVISGMDDKNAKNVVTLQDNTVQDNKTIQTNIQDIQTHTQQQFSGSGQLESPPPENCQNINAVGETNIQTQNTDNPNTPTAEQSYACEDISTLAQKALNVTQEGNGEKDKGALIAYLNDFFVKNCYGAYKPELSSSAIQKLADEILLLSDDANPPETVAGVMCSEFKKMCDGQRDKYWYRMPLLPANMIKPRAMSELIQYAAKILASAKNSERFMQAAKKAQEECDAEKAQVGDELRKEYLKYNIDPEDPEASKKIIVAKAQEAAAIRKAEDEDFEIF